MPRPLSILDRRAIPLSFFLGICACAASSPRPSQPTTTLRPHEQNRASIPQVSSDGHAVFQETIETSEHRYVGGTVYSILDVPAPTLISALESDNTFGHIMPRVWDFRVVSGDAQDKLVEIEQGTQLVRGRYTMRVQRDWDRRDGSCTVGFMIDQRYPSAIRDAYGSFHVRPLGPRQSLLTYQIRIDLGPGLIRMLFEEKVRRAALSPPVRLRHLMDSLMERDTAGLEKPGAGRPN